MTAASRMSLLDWALLILLSVIWGGSFFLNQLLLVELPALTLVFARVALAAAALWVATYALGQHMPMRRAVWAAFLGMGLLNNAIPFTLIVLGQSQIGSSLASILNATTPLFTVLVAHVLTNDEKISGQRLVGVVVGLIGVAIMVGGDALETFGSIALGHFAVLGAALSYACAGVFGRRFRRLGVSPMASATGQVTASSILLLPLVLFMDTPWALAMPSGQAVLSLVVLAVVCTALAYSLFFRILASAGATNLSLVTFLVPVSAIILGVLILHETLELYHLIGMIGIAAGLIAIDGRLLSRLKP